MSAVLKIPDNSARKNGPVPLAQGRHEKELRDWLDGRRRRSYSAIHHASEREQVSHPEVAGDIVEAVRQRRPPARVRRQERSAIVPQVLDEDFRHDGAADLAHEQAVILQLRLSEYVEEQRCRGGEI